MTYTQHREPTAEEPADPAVLLQRTELRLAGARQQLELRLAEVHHLQTEVARLDQQRRVAEDELAAFRATRSYRVLQPARRLYGSARRRIADLTR